MTAHSTSSLLRSCCLLLIAGACSGGSGDASSDGGNAGGDGGIGPDSGGNRADAGPPVGCDSIPALPATSSSMPWRSSEDFTFDAEGNLWGVSMEDQALHKITKGGERSIILPNVSSWGRGIRFLPGGDMVVAEPDSSSLLRITTAGVSSVLLGNIGDPNGVAVHPNGTVYLTSGGGTLYRIDPSTGVSAELVSGQISFDGITFSRDYRTIFYNTEGGQVFSLAVDAEGNAAGSPQNYAQIPKVEILDGMTLDDCDNLYVVEMSGIVWRVTPEKVLEKAVELNMGGGGGGGFEFSFISAVNFGSGVGGWDRNTLYIMDLDGKIHEANVGIGSKPVPHLP